MNDTVKIDSLYLAATLYHKGNEIISVDRSDHDALVFYFRSTDKLNQDIADFWTHRMELPDVLALWEDFKELKKKFIRGGQ